MRYPVMLFQNAAQPDVARRLEVSAAHAFSNQVFRTFDTGFHIDEGEAVTKPPVQKNRYSRDRHMTGADTLLRVLAQMGIDRIFSSPGSEWAPVWEAFAKAKAQSEGVPLYISSRHEEVAVGMASGYAKSTGKLPAVMPKSAEEP